MLTIVKLIYLTLPELSHKVVKQIAVQGAELTTIMHQDEQMKNTLLLVLLGLYVVLLA